MKKCTYCGTKMSGDFCPNCGKKFEAKPIIIKCPKCGNTLWNEDDYFHNDDISHFTRFCEKCGYQLEGNVFKIINGLIIADNVLYGVIDKNADSITIPKEVKRIRSCAFSWHRKISSIEIEGCLTEIDEDTFKYCGGDLYGSGRRNLFIFCCGMTKYQWLSLGRGNDKWWHPNDHSCDVICIDGSLEYKYKDD